MGLRRRPFEQRRGSIEGVGATDDPVDLAALAQEKFGKIRSVLPRHSGTQRLLHCDTPTIAEEPSSQRSILPRQSLTND